MQNLRRHLLLLDFALTSLLRRKGKNGALVLVFTFCVAVLSSTLFLTKGLKHEAQAALMGAPDLVVQSVMAGRHDLIDVSHAAEIKALRGVRSVRPRYWGYYYDGFSESNLTVMGLAPEAHLDTATHLEGRAPTGEGEVMIGSGVAKLRQLALGDELGMVDADNMGVLFEVVGIFDSESALLTNDLVVMTEDQVRVFFAFPPGRATDLVVDVANPAEVDTLAAKIHKQTLSLRPITRPEILRTYEAVFHWRSGMVFATLFGALVAFMILAWDKATGLSAEERREIGTLKAIGWSTSDVLVMKFWEGAALSGGSLLSGLILGYAHLYFFNAALLSPLLRGWSVLFPPFRLSVPPDLSTVVVVGFLTIVPYVAATVVPSWKAAITDPDTVMRGG